MKILGLCLLLFSFSAISAERVLLNCAFQGEGLSGAQLIEKSNATWVKVFDSDDSEMIFKTKNKIELGAMKDDFLVIVEAAKSWAPTEQIGGAVRNALLMNITHKKINGKKISAVMSLKGTLNYLDCSVP